MWTASSTLSSSVSRAANYRDNTSPFIAGDSNKIYLLASKEFACPWLRLNG